MSKRELNYKRVCNTRRELLALDKRWIRVGRVEQRRIETRMHTLRAELRSRGLCYGLGLALLIQGLQARVALGVG